MPIDIPGYEINEIIGQGGMARVYRARHLRLDRVVALKVMLDDLNRDPSFSERFLREARIAASLNHPNIVQIYDVDRVDGVNYLSMEYVDGGDLSHRLSDLSQEGIVGITRQIASALDCANELGYVHRDIKPANILFRKDGTALVSDFGIARAFSSDTHMTATGSVLGTPTYMSPEQAQGLELDGRSDLYSLAVIIFKMTTGDLPYESDSSVTVAVKHVIAPIPELPEALDYLQPFFNQALAKSPTDRFDNGAMLVKALDLYFNEKDQAVTKLLELTGRMPPARNATGHQEAVPYSGGVKQVEEKSAAKPKTSSNNEPQKKSGREFNKWLDRKVLAITLGLILLSGIAAGTWYWQTAPSYETQVARLSAGQRLRIQQLLSAAQLDMAAERLSQPAGNNAYEKYLSILSILPEQPQATRGIETIGLRLLRDAEDAISKQNWPQASKLLQQAETITPQAPQIADLKTQLGFAQQQQDQLLEDHLLTAQASQQSGDWENAIEHYQKVLQQVPGHSVTQQGLQTIGTGRLQLAEQALEAKNFDDAKAQLKQAEQVSRIANDNNLKQQVASTAKKISTAQNRQERGALISKRLGQAERAFNAGRLAPPDSSNAYDYYQQVLTLEGSNRSAKRGQEKIKATLLSQAQTALRQEQYERAEKTVNQLSDIAPRHDQLANLQRSLLDLRRKQAKDLAIRKKLDAYYDKATRYLEAGRPDSANKIYRRLVKMAQDDKGLKPLIDRIVDGYVNLAVKRFDAQDWKDVIAYSQRGLALDPGHTQLTELLRDASEKEKNRKKILGIF